MFKYFLLSFVLCIIVINTAFSAEQIAVLTNVQGDVKVFKVATGRDTVGNIGTLLYKGDEVKVETSGKAVIVFMNGKTTTITNGQKLKINIEGQQSSSIVERVLSTAEELTTQNNVNKLKSMSLGRTRDAIKGIYFPNNTNLIVHPTEFQWLYTPNGKYELSIIKYPEKDTVFKTTIYDPNNKTSKNLNTVFISDKIIENEDIKVITLIYPDNAKRLEKGIKYTLAIKTKTIETDGKESEGSTYSVNFRIITDSEYQELQNEIANLLKICNNDATSPTWHYLLANIYQAKGLYYYAEIEYKYLSLLFPDDENIKSILNKYK